MSLEAVLITFHKESNLVPRVSPLPAPWSERRGGKRRDPGNEVAKKVLQTGLFPLCNFCQTEPGEYGFGRCSRMELY